MEETKRLVWAAVMAATAIISVMLSAPVNAQIVLGSIAGTVTDETHAALPGVTITLTSPALQVPQMVTTSSTDGEIPVCGTSGRRLSGDLRIIRVYHAGAIRHPAHNWVRGAR